MENEIKKGNSPIHVNPSTSKAFPLGQKQVSVSFIMAHMSVQSVLTTHASSTRNGRYGKENNNVTLVSIKTLKTQVF